MICIAHPDSVGNEEEATIDKWRLIGSVVTVSTPWLNLFCERLQDDRNDQIVDYWRVEKDHSLVIVTIHRDHFVFPKPQYRPGYGSATLDFPGGRIPPGTMTRQSPSLQPENEEGLNNKEAEEQQHKRLRDEIAPRILQRELGIRREDLKEIHLLTPRNGWIINSSFSNQLLFGALAIIKDEVMLDPSLQHSVSYRVNDAEAIQHLLENDLKCLQCRSLLMEYLWNIKSVV